MKIDRLYQKQILQAAVGCEVLAAGAAEMKKLTDNRLLGGGVRWQ